MFFYNLGTSAINVIFFVDREKHEILYQKPGSFSRGEKWQEINIVTFSLMQLP